MVSFLQASQPKCWCTPHLPHARHMHHPSHPPCCDHPNNTGRRIQTMQLLMMQFSPASCQIACLQYRILQRVLQSLHVPYCSNCLAFGWISVHLLRQEALRIMLMYRLPSIPLPFENFSFSRNKRMRRRRNGENVKRQRDGCSTKINILRSPLWNIS
jgi:hypothetical protein